MIVPGTGIYLNNMLGEYDLVGGRPPRPGQRLTSMMAPTIALGRDGSPRLVVGSAGSARLRGAIMQIVVNVLEHGLGVEEAIAAPRVHVDEPHVHCEGGHDPAELDRLEALGYDVVRWRRRNLFFGGAAAVEVLADGTLRPPATRGGAAPASSHESSDRRPVAGARADAGASGPCTVRRGGARRRGALVALRTPSAPSRRAGCSPTRAGAASPTSGATSARSSAIPTRRSSSPSSTRRARRAGSR